MGGGGTNQNYERRRDREHREGGREAGERYPVQLSRSRWLFKSQDRKRLRPLGRQEKRKRSRGQGGSSERGRREERGGKCGREKMESEKKMKTVSERWSVKE
jgi:hypothetical protein